VYHELGEQDNVPNKFKVFWKGVSKRGRVQECFGKGYQEEEEYKNQSKSKKSE
jgi:hypothetical protein